MTRQYVDDVSIKQGDSIDSQVTLNDRVLTHGYWVGLNIGDIPIKNTNDDNGWSSIIKMKDDEI